MEVFPERGIPSFDGTPSKWKEFERRVNFFIAKCLIEKKGEQAGLLITTGLTGAAWDVVKDLSPQDLSKPNAHAEVVRLLKQRFERNVMSEISDDIDKFFTFSRKPGEILFDYIRRFYDVTKKIGEHAITLPKVVLGWLLLHRASLSREERQLVYTRVGATPDLDKVTDAMETIFGQEHKAATRRKGDGKHREQAHLADDEWEEPYYEEEQPDYDEAYETGYEESQEAYWQDDDAYWTGEDSATDYPAEQEEEEAYDPGEYDEIFAAYTDARRRFNELRLNRGFYPIVAVVDDGGGGSTSSPPKKGGKAKGRGRGTPAKGGAGRGRGKSKGKGQAKPSRSPTMPRPSRFMGSGGPSRPVPSSVCLRCGQTGHWAKDCPQAPNAKRPRSDEPAASYMVDALAALEGEI